MRDIQSVSISFDTTKNGHPELGELQLWIWLIQIFFYLTRNSFRFWFKHKKNVVVHTWPLTLPLLIGFERVDYILAPPPSSWRSRLSHLKPIKTFWFESGSQHIGSGSKTDDSTFLKNHRHKFCYNFGRGKLVKWLCTFVNLSVMSFIWLGILC